MHRRTSQHLNSRIHAYAASFGGDFARELIYENTMAGAVVLDPFMGAGTTALESILLNRSVIGIDIDPIACRISRVLTTRFDLDYIVSASQTLKNALAAVEILLSEDPHIYNNLNPGSTFEVDSLTFRVPSEPAIGYWFHPSHMATLSTIKEFVTYERDPLVRQLFEIALSACIIRKWPNTLSYAMDIDHSRPHRPVQPRIQSIQAQYALFYRVLDQIVEYILNIQQELKLREYSARILEGDSVFHLSTLDDSSVEFVLTSPPYLNAIDYPRAHKFSQWWLSTDKNPLTRSNYIGLRRSQDGRDYEDQMSQIPSLRGKLEPFKEMPIYKNISQYILDISLITNELYRVSKTDCSVAFVVANNVIAGLTFPVSTIIESLLEQCGFSSIVSTARTIKRTRRRYPFGSNGFAGPMRNEFLITGRKIST